MQTKPENAFLIHRLQCGKLTGRDVAQISVLCEWGPGFDGQSDTSVKQTGLTPASQGDNLLPFEKLFRFIYCVK